jgi:hypothetical protein
LNNKTRLGLKPILLILIGFLFANNFSFSQEKSNLDIFFELLDKSSETVLNETAEKSDYKLKMNISSAFILFENRLVSNLSKNTNAGNAEKNFAELSFAIEGASVVYGEPFKKNLFGDFYTRRQITLKGSYLIKRENSQLKTFTLTNTDTVQYSRISSLENTSFPFTKGEIPAEPLFSTIFEPILIVGAAAVSVYLFFTVRSK